MMIIGITGTIGAGKGTAVDYLKTKGFKHFAARDFLKKELIKRNLPLVRDNMTDLADTFRKEKGPEYMIGQLIEEAKESNADAIIESIRSLGEVEIFRKNVPGGLLLAIDADPKIRFERIIERGSSTDDITFEKFLEHEERENANTESWKNNLLACITKADTLIVNNGTVEEFNTKVEEILAHISPKKEDN